MKLVIKTVAALLLLAAASVQAQDLRSDHPEVYTVQKGDTLWDISGKFLQDPWFWPEIWHVNEQISNPHLIYPGDMLRLVYIDGQPRIVMDRGVVKLGPSVRSISHEDAITAIPLDEINEFFSQSRVVSQEELDAAPYMIAGPEKRILVAAGDQLYARGGFLDNVRLYQVFRPGEEYVDPDTGDVLGVRAEAKGLARYQSTHGEVTKLGLEESYKEISVGDVFLPLVQNNLDPELFPTVPEFDLQGVIISVEGGVANAGQFDVVAINRGSSHGLAAGSMLGILQKGEIVRDRIANDRVELPDEEAGMLMVFKSYDSMSFALILEALRPIAVGYPVTSDL